MTLNVGARAKIAHAWIDLCREEGVFGIWKFVSSRVGGHPSLLARFKHGDTDIF